MPVQEFHHQSAEHRPDGRSRARHQTHQPKHHAALVEWSLVENDVGQQRQGNTRAERHDQSCGKQHRKVQCERADERSHGKQQQIPGGQPLHHVGGNRKLFHQRRICDVQRSFRQNAEEGENGERHHHDGEFAFAHTLVVDCAALYAVGGGNRAVFGMFDGYV